MIIVLLQIVINDQGVFQAMHWVDYDGQMLYLFSVYLLKELSENRRPSWVHVKFCPALRCIRQPAPFLCILQSTLCETLDGCTSPIFLPHESHFVHSCDVHKPYLYFHH